jgi:riboflavin kinase/FMN adenylyltransferase
MLVIEWPQFLREGFPTGEKFSSMTVGVFDGVHRGHRALIERVVSPDRDPAQTGWEAGRAYAPVVVTFRQNHKTKKQAGCIQTFQQKTAMFESLGIQITLAIDFTESFRRMAGIEFLEILLKHGNPGFFAVGSNFRCGYRLDTDAAAIQRFFASRQVPVEIVPEVMEDGLPISSSRIRAAIANGDLPLAEKMLGRPVDKMWIR